MPRVLFVTHNYPPCSSIGAKRCLRIADALQQRGWQVDVLRAAETYYGGVDYGRVRDLPNVQVHVTGSVNPKLWTKDALKRMRRPTSSERVAPGASSTSGSAQTSAPRAQLPPKPPAAVPTALRALRTKLSALLFSMETPDPYIGWLGPAVARAATLPRPDVVITSLPWRTSAVAGFAVSQLLRVPLLVDYRDPWNAADRDATLPAWRVAVEHDLERRMLASTSAVTATTQSIADSLAPMSNHAPYVVYNAAEPGDFRGIPARKFERPTMVYTGGLYGGRRIEPLLEAMARVPSGPALLYMGASADHVAQAVAEFELGDRVQCEGPQPFQQAASATLGASANVCIVGPEHVRQIPGKLFEQMACGQPLLLLAPPDSEAQRVMTGLPGCAAVGLNDIDAIAATLAAMPDACRPIEAPAGFSVAETMDIFECAVRAAMASEPPR